jgi:SCP-2 sterol transfer family
MPDPTASFFARLAEREHHPALQRTAGSLRVDIDRGGKLEHWRVEMRRGTVDVSHSDADADCIIRADAKLFDDLTEGRANALASALRGELDIAGDPGMLVRFQRLFPPPTGRKMRSSARTIGKRRS